MTIRPIRYLPAAQQDLIEIFEYIQEDDPGSAAEFIDELDLQSAASQNSHSWVESLAIVASHS